ncbi:semaphorin-4A-like [Aplochiton taeniatus]
MWPEVWTGWLCTLLFLFLFQTSSASGLQTPRSSYLLGSADRPLYHFNDTGNTTTLLLSDDSSTLFVGARDAVISLDVSQPGVITKKAMVEWKASLDEMQSCSNKGKDIKQDCPNFVRVLQPINSTHLYACGTHTYDPHDTYIEVDSLAMTTVSGSAKGRCPHNPYHRNTAITIEGELFTGTTSDFMGNKPVISRHLSKDGRPDVNQDSSLTLLDDPEFVGSTFDPSDRKLYLFVSEVGKEYHFLSPFRVSRVVQVCKDDVGGQRTLQKRWTSFTKAQLLCQPPHELPFNVLQDVFTVSPPEGDTTQDTLFYAIFTSQWSRSDQSAVCKYRLQDIQNVFSGKYKNFDPGTHQWSPIVDDKYSLGKVCGLENASDSSLMAVRTRFLTSQSVRPAGGVPILTSNHQLYSRLAVHRTQAPNGKKYTVLFLLSDSGFLQRVALLSSGPHVIEEVQVFTPPQLVKTLLLSPAKGVVFVGTSEGVTQVPVTQCQVYRSCPQCILARDPLCGWDNQAAVCRTSRPMDNTDSLWAAPSTLQPNPNHFTVTLHNARMWSMAKWDQPVNSHSKTRCLPAQSVDGTLAFMATPDTLGAYHCVAEEGGFQETLAVYSVRNTISPRSMASPKTQSRPAITTAIQRRTSAHTPRSSAPQGQTEEEAELIPDPALTDTEEEAGLIPDEGQDTPPDEDRTEEEAGLIPDAGQDTPPDEDRTEESASVGENLGKPTEEKEPETPGTDLLPDTQPRTLHPGHHRSEVPLLRQTARSFHSELVVVSVLLVVVREDYPLVK